jgi:uncharacterized Zn finger protein
MKIVIVVGLLVAPFSQAALPPIALSFHELVAHPATYNGKRVSVCAYLVTSCEHCGEFFADPACAQHHREKHSVAIGRLVKQFESETNLPTSEATAATSTNQELN